MTTGTGVNRGSQSHGRSARVGELGQSGRRSLLGLLGLTEGPLGALGPFPRAALGLAGGAGVLVRAVELGAQPLQALLGLLAGGGRVLLRIDRGLVLRPRVPPLVLCVDEGTLGRRGTDRAHQLQPADDADAREVDNARAAWNFRARRQAVQQREIARLASSLALEQLHLPALATGQLTSDDIAVLAKVLTERAAGVAA